VDPLLKLPHGFRRRNMNETLNAHIKPKCNGVIGALKPSVTADYFSAMISEALRIFSKILYYILYGPLLIV
jgi:hypothetical protein